MKNLLLTNRILNPFTKKLIAMAVILIITLPAFSKKGGTNIPPTVSIINMAEGSTFFIPATVSIEANAAAANGTVTKVEFYAKNLLIGTVTTSPYTVTWLATATGTYQLTAIATDDGGLSTTSDPVDIIISGTGATGIITVGRNDSVINLGTGGVIQDTLGSGLGIHKNGLPISGTVPPGNVPPTVGIINMGEASTFFSPATVSIEATAADADGTVTKVEFYANDLLIGTVTTSPYTITWSNMPLGTYTLTAKATDNGGLSDISDPVNINVSGTGVTPGNIGRNDSVTILGTGGTTQDTLGGHIHKNGLPKSGLGVPPGNVPPTVGIINMGEGSTFFSPATVSIEATAADADGSVTKVEFYANDLLIGTVTTSPYTITWSGMPAGTYTLTAKATDNGGLADISDPVNINVSGTGVTPGNIGRNDSIITIGTGTVI